MEDLPRWAWMITEEMMQTIEMAVATTASVRKLNFQLTDDHIIRRALLQLQY